jgi:hypothetical protein
MKRLSDGKSLVYDYKEFLKRVNRIFGNLKVKQRVQIIKYMLNAYRVI